MKNYYELLELQPSATMEEVKKTFRVQIARYLAGPEALPGQGQAPQRPRSEAAGEKVLDRVLAQSGAPDQRLGEKPQLAGRREKPHWMGLEHRRTR